VIDPALRELRAAQAIVHDPACDDDLAAGHLVRVWQALARTTDLTDALAALAPGDRAALPPRALAELPLVLPALLAATAAAPPAWPLTHAVMERHLDALAAVFAARHTPSPGRARRVLRRLALGTAVIAALIVAVRPWQSATLGPWAATYYSRPDLGGTAVQRRDLDINFDWQNLPPMDTIPSDRFSVRWDACLTLDAAQDVAFQLTSDDGSRLFIAGSQVIDNWGRHDVRARGHKLALAAGVHHLRVEYFEDRDDATVTLSASFGPEPSSPPGPIPAALLHAPPGNDGDGDPCAVQ